MNLFINGIVIQSNNIEDNWYSGNIPPDDLSEFTAYRKYHGIGRYLSWPLSQEDDAVSKDLTKKADELWFNYFYKDYSELDNQQFAIQVVPDIDFCHKYLSHCQAKGIETRMYFCKTERETPIWEFKIPRYKFLGYDYADASLYSPIPDDLLYPAVEHFINIPVYKSFLECKQWLNNDKLFRTENEVLEFVNRRKRVEESDIEWGEEYHEGVGVVRTHLVEPSGDSVVFELYSVSQLDYLFH
jgi:hypothetical protein